ncbi:MAG: hypothetical protein H0W64_05065 [Gammaproteobacteria bacterium]|nr:hypothetical protein [Gammaproteobacteria bacterium]
MKPRNLGALDHGELDRNQAIERLANYPDGTLIVRYSSTKNRHYASIKNGNSTDEIPLTQSDIANLDYSDYSRFTINLIATIDTPFKKIFPLSTAQYERDSQVKESPKSFPDESFHGEIDRNEAIKRLADQPEGTFLFRYSSSKDQFFASIKKGNSTEEVPLSKSDIANLGYNDNYHRFILNFKAETKVVSPLKLNDFMKENENQIRRRP